MRCEAVVDEAPRLYWKNQRPIFFEAGVFISTKNAGGVEAVNIFFSYFYGVGFHGYTKTASVRRAVFEFGVAVGEWFVFSVSVVYDVEVVSPENEASV